MAGRYKSRLGWSDVTPEAVWMTRRQWLAGAAALGAMTGPATAYSTDEEPNSWDEITSYNNYFEFGTGKDDPKRNAGALTTEPWSIVIDGLVDRAGTYDLADILKDQTIEERIYRLRCVEAWSMVVPWRGIPLRNVVARAAPTNNARYVRFETVFRPEEMPGQKLPLLPWPYVEGLRLDEATNELPLLVTGLYGRDLPNQNGAPLRLIVPWKYGFKSIKSIVKISFVEEMPLNTWQELQPNEYGFFANVNPEVDHPRWSQARERPLPDLRRSRRTELFNGYAEQVGHMYRDMDLTRWY